MVRKQSVKPELLAPAGDLKRAKTAVLYGADAVYLGGQKYSLRSRASNFTMEDIAEICAFAKEHHARVHVTVNEIPHEEDFDGLKNYLQALDEMGVNAFIIASPSIMALARQCAPHAEVHCSTQMSVTNSAAARFLAQADQIDRIVLARECTMEEVRKIVKNCPVDTEAFIHGGMCVNYSGRCTLSNRMTLRDANRGGCAQSCRWFYHLYENGKEVNPVLYTMGSKDLCAVNEIRDLMEAGVRSFKIEGRMKTEYYVASVVSAYRHLIDELYENHGNLPEERMKYHEREILKGENREVCPGFYEGIEHAEIITHANSNDHVNHDFLGTVKEYHGGTAVLETRNPFDLHESLEVMEPGKENRSFILREMRNENHELLDSSRRPMDLIFIKVPFPVREGDIVRRAG